LSRTSDSFDETGPCSAARNAPGACLTITTRYTNSAANTPHGEAVTVGDSHTVIRVKHNVGSRYTVKGGEVLTAATLRLDQADVINCAVFPRAPANPFVEKRYYDKRRTTVSNQRLKVCRFPVLCLSPPPPARPYSRTYSGR
jgi:hypothetical protein